jgi:hypothetical protein
MGAIGTRLSFRYFGIVAGIVGLIYLALNQFWLKGLIRRRHEQGEYFDCVDLDGHNYLSGPILMISEAAEASSKEDPEKITSLIVNGIESELITTTIMDKLGESKPPTDLDNNTEDPQEIDPMLSSSKF